MPHKDDSKGWKTGPTLFWERPKYASAIMSVISAWAMVEQSLAQLYAELYDKKYSRIPAGSSGHDALGHAVFSNLESIHMRIRVFKAILDYIHPSLKSKFENDVEPALRKGARARNRLAHATWWISDKYPENLTMLTADNERISYSLSCIEEEISLVKIAQNKLASYRAYTVDLDINP